MTLPARDERRWTVLCCRECGQTKLKGDGAFEHGPHCTRAQAIEVMPVSEHEAVLAAARRVDEAMVERAADAHARAFVNSLDWQTNWRAALLAALTPEPEEKR